MKNVHRVLHACNDLRNNPEAVYCDSGLAHLSSMIQVSLGIILSSAACLTLDDTEPILLMCTLMICLVAYFRAVLFTVFWAVCWQGVCYS